MAHQIQQLNRRTPSLGESLGNATGEGLSGFLTNYAEGKIKHMHEQYQDTRQMAKEEMDRQRQVSQGSQLWKRLGASDAEANALAGTPIQNQQTLLKNLLERGTQSGGQQGSTETNGNESTQPRSLFDSFNSPHVPESVRTNQDIERNRQKRHGESLDVRKQELGQRKTEFETKEQRAAKDKAFSETAKYRSNVSEIADAARTSDLQLDRIDELNTKDRFEDPLFVAFRKYAGLPNAWNSKDTAELNQLASLATQDIKKNYGGNPSNKEMDIKLASLPTATDTKEQRAVKIRNIRFSNWIKQTKDEAMRSFISQNGDVPPRDLDEKVSRYMKKTLATAAPFYIQDKPLPGKLPNVNEYSPNAVVEEEESGKKYKLSDNGSEWILQV